MWAKVAVIALTSFALTYILVSFHIKLAYKRRIIAIDIHKPEKTEVADLGGVPLLVSILLNMLLIYMLIYSGKEVLSCIFVTAIAGLIGLIDDKINLGAWRKTAATILASLPIILMKSFEPRVLLPIVGRARITYVYQMLLPFSIAVTSNAVNMMEVVNGVMPATCILVLLSMLISLIILNVFTVWKYAIIITLITALLAYYIFNRYPSKVFSGNIGSFAIGAAIGAVAITCNIEIIAVIAFMPFIMNGFYILSSLKRLAERRQITRPTRIENGIIYPSLNRKAPITLVRIFVSKRPLDEYTIFLCFVVLTIVSMILAIATAVLIRLTYPV